MLSPGSPGAAVFTLLAVRVICVHAVSVVGPLLALAVVLVVPTACFFPLHLLFS